MSCPPTVTKQLASSESQDGHFTGSTLSDYWALTKPEVNFLILITTGVGFYLGCGSEARPFSLISLFNTLLGTLLVASGTGTLNQYIERNFDAQMRRTARRPAAAGRLKPAAVLAFGIALAASGTGIVAARVVSRCRRGNRHDRGDRRGERCPVLLATHRQSSANFLRSPRYQAGFHTGRQEF